MNYPSFETLQTALEKSALSIRLNRPQRHNALNNTLVSELKKAFELAEKDAHIKTIILRASGKSFCSGADLAYLQELRNYDFDANKEDSNALAQLFLNIYQHPKPVIAVVEGAALGGGCGLASVCDFIIASPEARFGYPEVKIGFIAAMVSPFLIRQVGERKARELLLTGKILSAREALEIGFINAVHDDEQVDAYLQEWLKTLEKNSEMALSATKRQLLASFTYNGIEDELRHLAHVNAEFRKSEDFVEGISAFIEKRKPRWIKNEN